MNALVGQEAKSNGSLFFLTRDECANDGDRKDGGDFASTGAGGHIRGGCEFEVLHDSSTELKPSWIMFLIFQTGWQLRVMGSNRLIFLGLVWHFSVSGSCVGRFELPNSHQARALASLLVGGIVEARCNRELLDRLLKGSAADPNQDEYFDERTGVLKLSHMDEEKTFVEGYQRAVIALYWKARHEHSIKWSDARTRTNCGRDPDSVFGKGVWREWLENVGHGLYRIRSRRVP